MEAAATASTAFLYRYRRLVVVFPLPAFGLVRIVRQGLQELKERGRLADEQSHIR